MQTQFSPLVEEVITKKKKKKGIKIWRVYYASVKGKFIAFRNNALISWLLSATVNTSCGGACSMQYGVIFSMQYAKAQRSPDPEKRARDRMKGQVGLHKSEERSGV